MMKSYFTLTLLALLTWSCGQGEQPLKDGHARINGTLENAANKTLYFSEYLIRDAQDSVVVDANGNFSIDVPTKPKVDYYRLFFDQKNMVVLILDSDAKNVVVNADADDFTNSYSVSGSKDSELMKSFFVANRTFISDEKDMLAKINSADNNAKTALNTEYTNMKTSYYNQLKEMALANPSSPAALSMVSNLHPSQYMDVYDKVFSELDGVMGHSTIYTDLKGEITKFKNQSNAAKATDGMMGKLAPEIAMNNPDGKVVKLSSLKGKYVLIDFWASWCGPCRRENPNVVAMYNRYKDKGFEIYGVSLDKDLNKWKAAITKDGLTWPHVSDLAGWQSSAAAKYGVRSIPHTVLLDKEGNVIATKLRGQALENKLAELLDS